jgi:hypothetical protein
MINRGPRNHQLMSQISDTNPFKKTLIPRAWDISEFFAKDIEALHAVDDAGRSLRRDLSPEGKRIEAQKAVRRALRDLRDLKKPLDEHHAKTETMRAKVKRPTFDKSDVVGAMARRELRDAARGMSAGQRAARLVGPDRDTDFIDALCELPAWASGINVYEKGELEIFEEARQSRLRDLHGPLLDQIAARDDMEKEVAMVVNMVRGDIQNDSGLESREFEAFAKPVESKAGAPWLKRYTENGVEVIRVVDFEAPGGPVGRIATQDEIRDGQFFKDHAEYLASRAA